MLHSACSVGCTLPPGVLGAGPAGPQRAVALGSSCLNDTLFWLCIMSCTLREISTVPSCGAALTPCPALDRRAAATGWMGSEVRGASTLCATLAPKSAEAPLDCPLRCGDKPALPAPTPPAAQFMALLDDLGPAPTVLELGTSMVALEVLRQRLSLASRVATSAICAVSMDRPILGWGGAAVPSRRLMLAGPSCRPLGASRYVLDNRLLVQE